MIYRFNLLFLFLYQAHAMDVFKLGYVDDFSKSRLALVKNILMDKYLIPELLITENYQDHCQLDNVQAMVHLCLDDKGELHAIHIDQDFFLKTVRTFSQGDLR